MITRASLEDFSIALRTPVLTANGTISHRRGVLLKLIDEHGGEGVGEVAPLPGWSGSGLEHARTELGGWIRATLAVGEAAPFASLAPEVRAGIDAACWVLRAQADAVPLWQAISSYGTPRVRVNALLSSGTPEQLASAAERAQADGFDTLKVKVGMANDVARLTALAATLGPGVLVRLDANGGWPLSQAVQMADTADALLGGHLEYVEDPVAQREDIEAFRDATSVVLALDHLANSGSDFVGAVETADVVVLKPPLVGGITEVLDMAATAAALNVDVVISSLLDGPVGLRSWCHLAAALGGTRAHGLGTGALLDSAQLDPLLALDGFVHL